MHWKAVTLGAAALIAAGCSPPPEDASSAQTRQTIEAVFAAFNRHDAAAMAALYAPDAMLTTSERCAPLRGRAAVERLHADLFAAVPDIADEVTDYFVDGERGAIRFVSRSAIPGREFEMMIADFFVVRDGLVVTDNTVFNAERPCS